MADYLSAYREAGSENEPYFVQTLQTLPLDGLSGTVDGSSSHQHCVCKGGSSVSRMYV